MPELQAWWDGFLWALGIGCEELNVGHMALRAVVVYIAAIAMIRLSGKRLLGRASAFDVVLAIIIGSVVSRAITGSSPFFPTLAAGIVLIWLHWLFAAIAFRSRWFGFFVKGRPIVIVRDGEILWDAMRRSHLSENDLLTALRTQASLADLSGVAEARLERSGDISVIASDPEPRVLDVDAAEGVQTVRIRLE